MSSLQVPFPPHRRGRVSEEDLRVEKAIVVRNMRARLIGRRLRSAWRCPFVFGCKARSNLGGSDSAQRIGLERIVSRSDLFAKPTLHGVIPDHQRSQVRFVFLPNTPCFRSLSNSTNQEEPLSDLPTRLPNMLFLFAYSVAIYYYASFLFKGAYEKHLTEGGRRGSWWVVIGVSLLALLALLGVVLAVGFSVPSVFAHNSAA